MLVTRPPLHSKIALRTEHDHLDCILAQCSALPQAGEPATHPPTLAEEQEAASEEGARGWEAAAAVSGKGAMGLGSGAATAALVVEGTAADSLL